MRPASWLRAARLPPTGAGATVTHTIPPDSLTCPNNFTIARAYTVPQLWQRHHLHPTITVFASQGATALPISLGQAADYSVLPSRNLVAACQIEVYQSATVINGNVGRPGTRIGLMASTARLMAESIMIPPILPRQSRGRSPVAFIRFNVRSR